MFRLGFHSGSPFQPDNGIRLIPLIRRNRENRILATARYLHQRTILQQDCRCPGCWHIAYYDTITDIIQRVNIVCLALASTHGGPLSSSEDDPRPSAIGGLAVGTQQPAHRSESIGWD